MFSTIAARLRAWREREQAYQELMALDDRSLSDIGLRRADIPFVLSGDVTRECDVIVKPTPAQPANANAAGSTRKVA
jgi:uncharacterized protein YjiS (DUF1127 family)